jgi:hypothetical protein
VFEWVGPVWIALRIHRNLLLPLVPLRRQKNRSEFGRRLWGTICWRRIVASSTTSGALISIRSVFWGSRKLLIWAWTGDSWRWLTQSWRDDENRNTIRVIVCACADHCSGDMRDKTSPDLGTVVQAQMWQILGRQKCSNISGMPNFTPFRRLLAPSILSPSRSSTKALNQLILSLVAVHMYYSCEKVRHVQTIILPIITCDSPRKNWISTQLHTIFVSALPLFGLPPYRPYCHKGNSQNKRSVQWTFRFLIDQVVILCPVTE